MGAIKTRTMSRHAALSPGVCHCGPYWIMNISAGSTPMNKICGSLPAGENAKISRSSASCSSDRFT